MIRFLAPRLRRPMAVLTLAIQSAIGSAVVQEIILSTPGHVLSRPAQAQSDPAQRVYGKAGASVVFIETTAHNGDLSTGSGIVVEANGLIVTNAHVVANATKVVVQLSDNQRLEAEVLSQGSSQCLDLALLRIKPNRPLPSLAFAPPAERGQRAYAIGYPQGITPSSITQGIISNLYPDNGLIQTDASLNPGNSGGALLNQNGELIGIGKGGFADTVGMNLAVSVEAVQGFLQAYRQSLAPNVAQGLILRSGQAAQSIALTGKTMQGRLQASDHVMCADQSRADLYTFQGKAGQLFMLNMLSQELHPYLVIQDPQGNVIAKSGSNGGPQAQLLGRLPMDGVYTLLANAETKDETGRYAIIASMPVMVREDEIDSSLPVCFKDGSRCVRYQFEGDARQELAIDVTASFAPYILLVDAQGNEVSAAPGSIGQNRVQVKLPKAGTYDLYVSTVDPAARGRLQVTVHDSVAQLEALRLSLR